MQNIIYKLTCVLLASVGIQAIGGCVKDTQTIPNIDTVIPEVNYTEIVVPESSMSEDVPAPEYILSDYERSVVEAIVMGEAEGESYEGQILVAQCLLNACLLEDENPSVIRTLYGYAGWNEHPSESVKKAVSAVFDEGFKITEEQILYFYNPKHCYSKFHESQRYVLTEGNHRFFAPNN